MKLSNIKFVMILLAALVVGVFWQDGAQWLAAYRQWLLFAVMILVGMEQDLPALAGQFRKVGAILLSLAGSYLLFPLVAWGLGLLFFGPTDILPGFIVLGAVPVTITSAVIYTRLDKGNDRLALVIVLMSQLLSVFVTPLIVFLLLSQAVEIPVAPMILSLLQYFLAPLAIGMLLRRLFPLQAISPYLALPEQLVIVIFVFMGAGHIPHSVSLTVIGKAVLAVILIQMAVVVVVRFAIRRFSGRDQTALFYTGTQKTLTVGLYLLLSYFPDVAILPMVLYHVAQLAIGRLYWLPPRMRRSPCV